MHDHKAMLSNLHEVASKCKKNNNKYVGSVLVMLIDVNRPLYREKDSNYIVEIKVIDYRINDKNIFGVMIRYCSVYITSSNYSDLAIFGRIGDLIYLHRCTFSIWNDIKLETRYVGTIDGIYKIVQQNSDIFTFGQRFSLAQIEQPALILKQVNLLAKDLKEWFDRDFKKVFAPKIGVSIVNSFCVSAEPFSMILQVVSAQKDKHILQDGNNNKFYIDLSEYRISKLDEHEFIYIRSVACITNNYEIKLSSTGNILRLSSGHEEYFQEIMNYSAIHKFNQKMSIKQPNQSLTCVEENSLIPIPIRQLQRLEQKYKDCKNKSQFKIDDFYLLEAVVINYEGNLKLYHKDYQIIIDHHFVSGLSLDERKDQIQRRKIIYIYEGTVGIIDRSSEDKQELFRVHLFTNDSKGTFMESPPSLQALQNRISKGIREDELRKAKMDIQLKIKKLACESNFSRPVRLIAETIKSDILLFRMVDTRLV